ncbi:hypothetical protein I203_100243 [Kwoniella mangroviensis CBS 8507]|uniref:uncharacterized protein n=1 Tax=Kwoniella mangroviensis CBS 8507 TaxID=1296122 RepID=UPI00080D79BD|nr:uncharacterized protein I203_05885 [Kwoniella mangroviensis CBS 8507]OCF65143.1 hypothetical protein I203_05885 [Kwoniella mangroviensis CBS 8507]
MPSSPSFDPLSVFQQRPSSSSSSSRGFKPPPPVSPSATRTHSQSLPPLLHTQPRRPPPPSATPPLSSSYQPRDDPFSRSHHLPSPSTLQHTTPRPPHPSASSARPRITNSSVSPKTPRTAQEIYEKSREKIPTGVDKILAHLSALDKKSSERDVILNQKIDGMNKEIFALKTDNRNLRDQLHELKLGQNSLATREEMVEEITTQFTSVFSDIQGCADKIATLPSDIASLSASKIIPHIPQSQIPSGNDTALINLLNHVSNKLSGIDNLIVLLGSLQGLPEAITSVAVFKDALDGLTTKVEEFSQHSQSQSAAAPPGKSLTRPPPTPISPPPNTEKPDQNDERLKKCYEILLGMEKLMQKHAATQEEIKQILLQEIRTSNNSNNLLVRSLTPSSIPTFEATRPNSLEDLAEAAVTQERLGTTTKIATQDNPGRSFQPLISGTLHVAHTSNFGSIDRNRSASLEPQVDLLDLPFPASPDFSQNQDIITSTPRATRGTTTVSDSSLALPPASMISSGPDDTPQASKKRSVSSSSSRSTKKAKISADPSDRPVTRLMSNKVREPIRWNPSSHMPSTTKNKTSPISRKGSSRTTICGRSIQEVIEISSGSSSSPPCPKSKYRSKKSRDPTPNTRDIAGSALFSETITSTKDKENSLNSGVESIPSGNSSGGSPRPLRSYGSAVKGQAAKFQPRQSDIRAQARAMELEMNKRRMTSVPTLGSSVNHMRLDRNTKGKRKMDCDFDDSF